jgi:hypothetical protein
VNRDDAVFGPLKRFADGGDSWKEIAKVIVANKSKKYNPIVAAAFAGAAPNNFPDLFAIYGRIFAQVADKERDYVKAAATYEERSGVRLRPGDRATPEHAFRYSAGR